jgi:hypothetical protein
MAENHPSPSPPDGRAGARPRLVTPSVEPATTSGGEDAVLGMRAGGVGRTRALSRSACTGKVTWMTVPDRDVSECVLPGGHGGDHRDAGGYPWNEGRWLD